MMDTSIIPDVRDEMIREAVQVYGTSIKPCVSRRDLPSCFEVYDLGGTVRAYLYFNVGENTRCIGRVLL